MYFSMVRPTGLLKDYIKYYCFMESDVNEPDVTERVVPTENIQLMFHYKRPFVYCRPDNKTVLQPRTIISGLSNSFSDVSTYGEAGVIFVAFYPDKACHFFKFSLSDIENQSLDMSDIFGNEIREIEERLFLKKKVTERIEIVEEFLRSKFSPVPAYDSLLMEKCVELIKQYGGRITASALAERLYTGPRSLERKFSEYIGKTPKQFIKLIRFQLILTDFSNNKNINLTEYAYQNGYFDQSHFIRDFKAYTGVTPGDFLVRYPCYDINKGIC